MPALLESLITALVPILVKEAEALLGTKPPGDDHNWIVGLVNDVCGLLEEKLPAWFAPSEDAIKDLVEESIAKILKI